MPDPSRSPALPDAAPLQSGTPIQHGAYLLHSVLGQGGFGIAYRAEDMRLHRPVVIKEFFPAGSLRAGRRVLSPRGWSERGFAIAKERFEREGQILARFDHPGVVRIFATFEENNTVYLVLECLEGRSFDDIVSTGGALPEQEALDYIHKAGTALEAVHEAGLLHRDIKPENIIVTQAGRVALIDFGLTKEQEAAPTTGFGTRVLDATRSLGTPGYAPLEQYTQQGRLGNYTDIYALGATLYFLLTGEMPISAPDRAHGAPLATPRDMNPNVSRATSQAVLWAMQMKPEDRPSSVRDFLSALPVSPTAEVKSLAPASSPPQTLDHQSTSKDKSTSKVQSTSNPSAAKPRISLRELLPDALRGAAQGAIITALGGPLLGAVAGSLTENNAIGGAMRGLLTLPIGALAGAVIGTLRALPAATGWATPAPVAREDQIKSSLRGALKGAALGAVVGFGMVLYSMLGGVITAAYAALSGLALFTLAGAVSGAIVGAIGIKPRDRPRRR